ncbi:hypothetical protein J1N35_036295 [Gossypium stocksii]|uniref:Uncharacterized protein n=1 Tax=Gossypium stocksii TaxID=47602 RepID=A0A9D3ZJU4_9ROSI|nr:hypothetical protein J1N35_036295 [Gossypium stocksii]
MCRILRWSWRVKLVGLVSLESWLGGFGRTTIFLFFKVARGAQERTLRVVFLDLLWTSKSMDSQSSLTLMELIRNLLDLDQSKGFFSGMMDVTI